MQNSNHQTANMSARSQGAKSQVWIKREIENNFWSPAPITAVLEVSISIEADGLDNNQRSRIRGKVIPALHASLIGTSHTIRGNEIACSYYAEQKDRGIDFVTKDSHAEIVKSLWMKKHIAAFELRCQQDFHPDIKLNFVITKPLEYMPGLAELLENE